VSIEPMHASPRCGAYARTTGNPCQSPAMKNGRYRMHGGKSKGPPKGSQNKLKQGLRTAEAVKWQTALERDPGSACKRGSGAVSMTIRALR